MKIIIKGNEIKIGYRRFTHQKGCMICKVAPWGSSGCPITLIISINPDGTITHRGWYWYDRYNPYLHTNTEVNEVDITENMIDTVSGLFSGRILVDGVKLAVGKSVQDICKIDVKKEEAKIGKKIYLN